MAFKKRTEFPFKEYQKAGVKFALANRYSLNADEPGLGKTRQAIGCILMKKRPAVVIAPAYLLDSWKQELANTELIIAEFDHNSSKSYENCEVVLMTYYQVRFYSRFLNFKAFGMLIIDESHAFKNLEAKRTEHLVEWIDQWIPEFLLLMSGTPIKNNVPEMFVPLYLKSLDKFNPKPITEKYPTFYTFAVRFSNVVNKSRGQAFSGVKNLPELKEYLKDFMIRRRADEVLELPDEVENDVFVSYDEDPMLLEIFTAFRGETSPEIQLKMESASSKASFTASFADSLYTQTESPLIVYSDHRTPIEIIESELPKYCKTAVITGSQTRMARDRIARDFKSGRVTHLLATIKAIKEGLTLIESNNMIGNDLSWVPSDNIQIRARIRRIGQCKKCFYHNVMGSNIDQKIARMIRDKMEVIKKVL